MSAAKVVFIKDWEPKPVEWIWPGWLARGKLTILGGNAGTGKSTLTQAIAAIVTTGGEWPDSVAGSPRRAEQGYFMCWDGEDDLNDTTGPRFLACGGNREFYLPIGTEEDGEARAFNPRNDIPKLREAAKELREATKEYGPKLSALSISPLVALRQSQGADENANVRQDLEELVNLAEELNIAVIGIHHLSKGTSGRDPLERLTGSLAYGAISRGTMIAVMSGDQTKARLVRVKNSLGLAGGGIDYTIEASDEVKDARGEKIHTSRIRWGKPIAGSAENLIAEIDGSGKSERKGTKVESAMDFLGSLLMGGPVPRKRAVELAGQETPPIAEHTLDRAAAALRVQTTSEGWALRAIPPAMPEAAE